MVDLTVVHTLPKAGNLLLLGLALLLVVACSSGSGGSSGQATQLPRDNAAPTRVAGPNASIEPRSGPPGTQVTVNGTGWPPGVTVDLTDSSSPGVSSAPFASATTDSTGSFTAGFRLERAADGSELRVGRFDLVARSASTSVSVPFQVETRRPVTGPGPGG
jgi:hypothetical protein